ncbi:hypothetical protein QQ020_10155 [Fulvivirgaceae bacterium BMA12]|uniref:Lipoprotein n=1 Tax=Agaribacillus aureus TaxID=3051825 RepID=A0ABT8L5T4_9BACT|nr:hypothetical protein [Fulvivirgaceae bacterium BMA12]
MKSFMPLAALITLLLVFSCQEKSKNEESEKHRADSLTQKATVEEAKMMAETSGIIKTESVTQDSISISVEKDLFGTFFGGRATFFIVNEPENLIHGAKIKNVTFCYLDGALSRSKYVLEDDISEKLIETYGSFRIKGYDVADRKIIADRLVMVDYGQGKELNHDLQNFELSWAVGEGLVKVRVNRDSINQSYEYIEQLSDYKLLFKSIEYGSL